jgi:hypothetical protein
MSSAVETREVDALPEMLEGAERVGPHSVARPGALLRVVSGVGRFLAHEGRQIDYAPEAGADPRAVQAVLDGAVLGALLHQRGELPLHATTLVAPEGDRAIALAGPSGAGKSTTGFALVRAGWTLLSDDLTRVTLVDGVPTAWPGRSRLRLLDDACMRFELDTHTLEPAPNWPDKFVVALPQWSEPVPLAAVIVLDPASAGALETVSGAAAARLLAEQTYRLHYVAALGQARRHFELIAATAAHARLIRIGRGQNIFDTASKIAATC